MSKITNAPAKGDLVEKAVSICRESLNRVSDAHDVNLYRFKELAEEMALTTEPSDSIEELKTKYEAIREQLLATFNDSLGSRASGFANASDEAARAAALGYFLKTLCGEAERLGAGIKPESLFDTEPSPDVQRIAYIKNAISDEAYRKFSKHLKKPSVIYPQSFLAACEEVYYGRVEYCILPYETSDEGILSGFMKLIRKYELVPICICSVDGDKNVTKLALLGRSYSSEFSFTEKKYLKITVDSIDRFSFLRLFSVAESMNLMPCKSESVPVSWNEGRFGISVTFDANAENVVPFLLYVALEMPECSDKILYGELAD